MSEHCPTCGAEVRVVTSGEGTSHYEPVAEAQVAELRQSNELYEAMCKALEIELFGNDMGRSRDELVERAAVLASSTGEERPIDFNKGAKHVYEVVEEGMRELLNEVDCRIEHGAESFGHLDYVRARLRVLCDLFYEVNGGEER